MMDSVHKLLSDQIEEMGFSAYFDVTDKRIVSKVGSEFIFKGIRINPNAIRSVEAVDRCWVEEAQVVSAESWAVLLPSLFRVKGCELIVSFNPDQERDATYQHFVVNPPPSAVVRHVGWEDNPWFPEGLEAQRRHMLATDPDAYEWVWGGHCRHISDAIIFRHRVSVEAFETPTDARFFHGADWGFANDPTVLVRCWLDGENLMIDREVFGFGTEIDNTPALFEMIETARSWPIKADGARPETISYMARQGFRVSAADKWPGSVEDGVEHLRGFKRIVVHERCKKTAEEFRLYSYKVDRNQVDPKTLQPLVLPVIVDKHNHAIDALRYALDGYIKGRRPLVVTPAMLARFSQPRRSY